MLSNKRLTLSQDLPLFAIGSINATPTWDPTLSTSPPPSLTSNLPPFKFPDSRLTFSRGSKRVGPGMRLKLPPFCREHHVQLEFPQKKGQTQALFSQYFWEGGKGDSFSDIFCEVSSFLNVFSAELPTYKRELLNCAKIISEKSPCGVPSDV